MSFELNFSETIIQQYSNNKEREIQNYSARVKETYERVKDAYPTSSQEIWRCDPNKHVRGQSIKKIRTFR